MNVLCIAAGHAIDRYTKAARHGLRLSYIVGDFGLGLGRSPFRTEKPVMADLSVWMPEAPTADMSVLNQNMGSANDTFGEP
jgi:hypothetical protein